MNLAAPNEPQEQRHEPPPAPSNLKRFLAALHDEGAGIQEGILARVDFFKLYEEGKVTSCNGNNADNPYFACALPRSPGQPLDVLDFIEVDNPVNKQEKLHISIHLQPSEAVVLVGTTPPEVKYFSFVPFLTTSRAHLAPPIPDTPHLLRQPIRNKPVELISWPRRNLFAGLGDPLNNLKISTPGTPAGAPGYPFEQPYLLIYGADQGVLDEVCAAARKAGYPQSCLNTIVVSGNLVSLGVDHDADTFSFAHRIANNPADPQKLAHYLKHPPVRVFRVTTAKEPQAPLPVPLLSPRGSGRTELDLWRATERLRQAILQHHERDFTAVELLSDIWLNESYLTIQQGLDNLGESRDTSYFATEAFVLPEDGFLVAYGVNHAQAGKSLYSNLVVYGSPLDNGLVSVANNQFGGSAGSYLDDPQSPYLYAWKLGFGADRFKVHYTAIPTVDAQHQPPYGLHPHERLFLGFRAYVDPATKVGPAWHEMIMDRVILFLPKK